MSNLTVVMQSAMLPYLQTLNDNNHDLFKWMAELMDGRFKEVEAKVDKLTGMQVEGLRVLLGRVEKMEKVVGVKDALKSYSSVTTAAGVDGSGGDEGGGSGVRRGDREAAGFQSLWSRLDSLDCDISELLERMRDPQAGCKLSYASARPTPSRGRLAPSILTSIFSYSASLTSAICRSPS